MWNNTAEQQGLHGALGTGTSAYQWRPIGKVVNMSRAYSWNVTIPNLPAVSTSPTIREVIPDDLLLGSFGNPGGVDAINPGCTIFAISLKPTSRGALLWIRNYTAPPGNLTRTFGLVDPVNRVFILQDTVTMQNLGYSIDDGSLLWGPLGNPISDYSYYSWSGVAGGGLPG